MTKPATETHADPLSAIITSKGAIPRGLGLLAGLATTVLPAFTSTAFGMTQMTTMGQAMVLPVITAIALVAPAIVPLRPYTRLIDSVAVAAGVVLLAYTGYVFIDAQRQISAMPGMAGRAAQSVSVSPSFGLLAIILGTVAMAIAALQRGRR